uniref:Uncharacterized protein n=1 Tax=Klebsiella pneumoniae TaxID=573 RepID=A0A8B0SX01_KLEPN|nr:hypothetical protein [Klebsiella pneumoniae]
MDNQYIVSLAVAFPTICCPSPFYFVIAQCEKNDITVETLLTG